MACKQPFVISLDCKFVIKINCKQPLPGQIDGAVSGCFTIQLNIVDSDCIIIIVVEKLQTGSGGGLKAIQNGLHHIVMWPAGGGGQQSPLVVGLLSAQQEHFIAIR